MKKADTNTSICYKCFFFACKKLSFVSPILLVGKYANSEPFVQYHIMLKRFFAFMVL